MNAPQQMSSLTLIAAAMQRELFNRGVGFLTVDDCQEILRVSIDKALRTGERVTKREPETAE